MDGWTDRRTELELDATGVFIYLPILLDEHGHIQKSLVSEPQESVLLKYNNSKQKFCLIIYNLSNQNI